MRTNLNVAPRQQVLCSPDGETVVGIEDRTCDGRFDGSAQAGRMHRAVIGAAPPGGPGSGAQGAVRTFAFSRDAPAAARHFAVGALRRWGIADLADDVALVVTELAANAVRHARTGFTVILSSRPSRPSDVRVSVRDASPLPSAGASGSGSPLPVTPLHGLGAVNAMASHWGVESLGSSGKTVWVELRG
jgi:histidine kinase-like protein